MHYGKFAFSKNVQPTIVPKNRNAVIGQRQKLSDSDITQINIRYCPGKS